MRSGNPALSDKSFKKSDHYSTQTMTIQGTVNKTFVLLLLLIITSIYSLQNGSSALMIIGAIGGFIVAMITIFKPAVAGFTAPLYALLQGLFVGAISAYYNAQFTGIVFQAVLLTFGTLFSLLLAYKTQLIKVTKNFRLGVMAATGAIFVMYLISFIGSFFGLQIPYLHDSSPIGIGISLVIVVIAALNLVLDFDFIENASRRGAAKHYEWYGAFGLMVTLIWLYIEMLRLLSKIRSR